MNEQLTAIADKMLLSLYSDIKKERPQTTVDEVIKIFEICIGVLKTNSNILRLKNAEAL